MSRPRGNIPRNIPVIDRHNGGGGLVAVITVHLPYGFTAIKLRAVTAAGPQFGPPGYETNLLYIAALATLVLGGSGPLAIDAWLPRVLWNRRVKNQ